MDDERSPRSITGDLDVPGFAIDPSHRQVAAVLPVVRASARRLADDLEVLLTYLPVKEPRENAVAGGGALAIAGELSRLRHDHLIRIHDVVPVKGEGSAPSRLVLATASAGGGSLTELLTRRSPLSVGEALTVASPMADALTHLHRQGVVHGALTTDSVLFTDRGMPLLADTGIDNLACVALATMAAGGTSAPEISEGYEATTASDAYAFAVVIWTALVGAGPGWVGDRGDLAELAPHVPARVVSVLTSALSPDPGERPEIWEIASHVGACAIAEPIDLAEIDAGRDVPRRIRALAARQPTTHRAPRRRGTARLVVVAVAALAVALAFSTLVLPGPLNLLERDALASAPTADTTLSANPESAALASPEMKASTPSAATTRPPGTVDETSAEKVTIQTLIDARAAAWEAADPGLLAKAHSPGSAAMTTDRDELGAAISQGSHVKDLEFVVQHVDMVERVPRAAASLADTDELTARITVRREPVTLITSEGQERTVMARSDVVDVTLRRTPAGWRFVSWE